MRFMMLMIPGVYQGKSGAELKEGFVPSAEAVSKMMKFNFDMGNAGVLVTLDGLHPAAKGARVSFNDGAGAVTDGPFAETKEVVGGYWIIKVNSKQEAIEWALKCPAEDGDAIEIRQLFDMEDFPEEVQEEVKSKHAEAGIEV